MFNIKSNNFYNFSYIIITILTLCARVRFGVRLDYDLEFIITYLLRTIEAS
jgi:hypothetical protein